MRLGAYSEIMSRTSVERKSDCVVSERHVFDVHRIDLGQLEVM